jgi:hypothetical protein
VSLKLTHRWAPLCWVEYGVGIAGQTVKTKPGRIDIVEVDLLDLVKRWNG